MSGEQEKPPDPDKACWFDTLPPVPKGQKRRIRRIIAASLQSLAKEVAGAKVWKRGSSQYTPALEELVTDESKEHPAS